MLRLRWPQKLLWKASLRRQVAAILAKQSPVAASIAWITSLGLPKNITPV
jgi:hypothetical protein